MGKRSRSKHNREPAPLTRLPLSSYLPDRATVLFVFGVVLIVFGTPAIQYSRWNHAENAHVHPVFHLWLIVLGLIGLFLSFRKSRDQNRM
jgi:uncharacterized membrane protein HdeD (DUF308 family)